MRKCDRYYIRLVFQRSPEPSNGHSLRRSRHSFLDTDNDSHDVLAPARAEVELQAATWQSHHDRFNRLKPKIPAEVITIVGPAVEARRI